MREKENDEQIKMLKLVNLDEGNMGVVGIDSCNSSLSFKLFPNKMLRNVNKFILLLCL